MSIDIVDEKKFLQIYKKIKGCLTTPYNPFVNLKSNTIMKNHGTKVRPFFE